MQIDLSTLYYLIIGTVLVALAMMLWERQAHPRRAQELGLWAGAFLAFAVGLVVGLNRAHFPGVVGGALANLAIVTGYLLILHGVARLDGPARLRGPVAILVALALLWATVGVRFPGALWNYLASLPITLACGLTAWTLMQSRTTRSLRARKLVIAVAAGHGLFNLGRAALTPLLVATYGDRLLPVFGELTMYEGVLYSVAMPMGLIGLVREEAQADALAAARTDYLTGLQNRHGFFEGGARLLRERPVVLLAFDLDHFKAINDRHGHAAGDAVLRLFSDTARAAAGPDALVARLGGEEFAALLPGRDVAAGRIVGESIARLFAAASRHGDGPGIPATVSVGLAATRPSLEGESADLSALLSAADRALYQAKAGGRNRLEVAAAA